MSETSHFVVKQHNISEISTQSNEVVSLVNNPGLFILAMERGVTYAVGVWSIIFGNFNKFNYLRTVALRFGMLRV